MDRSRAWLVVCLGVLLAVVGCGARDTGVVEASDASSSTASYAPTSEQQIRAAYVSARQAEATTDPTYAFHPAGQMAEALHPQSQLRARVDLDGVTLSRDTDPWKATLHTASVGCSGSPHDVASSSAPASLNNQTRIDKSAGDQHFVEWYTHGALGLEQGWTFHESLCPTGALELRVDVAGLAVANGKDGLELRDASGASKVHYTDAWARDAKGRSLETTMSAHDGKIAIVVDTRSAVFPVEVDPLVWFQQQELLASDGQMSDYFGQSVAVSGALAVIGAPNATVGANTQQGAAYVFVQSGSTWTEQQKLVASDGTASDFFGNSVAISGGTVVVGAYAQTVGSNTSQGAAYVFVQSGVTWTQQQKLVANDGAASDSFGVSVGISGGTAVVGAENKAVTYASQGAAYVFVQNGTVWSQQQRLVSSDGAANDRFGHAVAVSGGTAVVAAHYKTVGANSYQGAAYVFVQSGTTWNEEQRLTASGGKAYDEFGFAAAVSGNTVVVGSYSVAVGGAYVFLRTGTTWTQQQQLVASDGASIDEFGRSVAVSGDTAVVGAQFKTVGPNLAQGAAYVFARSGSTWTEQQKLTANNGGTYDLFGSSAAVSGTTTVLGAYYSNNGAAYVFNLGTSNGTVCAKPSDCGSGFCVDGFCCDTACKGVCQACAATVKQSGKDGICGPALNGTNPHNDPDCKPDLPSACGRDGMCDGTGACRLHPPTGTKCATTCSAAQETTSTCDSNFKCVSFDSRPCGRYVCDTSKCKTACTTSADCNTAFACQAGVCVPGTVCVDNESHGTDGKVVRCAPYQCDKSGTCKSACSSVDDCVAPASCNPSGKCAPPAASNSGGCSTSGAGGTSTAFVIWLLMGVVTRRRLKARGGKS